MSAKKLFFANLPDLESLKGFKATHNVTNTTGMQPTCCRELLFTMPDVLVSPAFDNKKDLFIIAQASLASSQKFLNQLNKLQIKLCSRLDVDAEFFQYCLTYSIYQKLAPFWNKTGSFLAQGRSFLQECEKFSAIRLELTVTDKICLTLEPFLVKMQPPMLEDFMIDSQAEYNFKRMKGFTIMSSSIQDLSCYVLPSLKEGKVHSITHEIPLNAPFKSYDEMKQHWKVMYGYRLPSGSCNMYFNVKFFGSTIFTYPEWCIRKIEPIVYFRCDFDAICKQFLQDLFTRMPSMCGGSLRFTKESFQWQKSLLSAKKGSNSFLIKSVTQLSKSTPQVQKALNPASSKKTNSTNIQRCKGFQYIKYPENTQNNSIYVNPIQNKTICVSTERHLPHKGQQNLFLNHSLDNSKTVFDSELKISKNVIDIPDSPFVVTSPCFMEKLADSNCNEKLNLSDKSFNNNLFTSQDICVVPDVNYDLCIVPDVETEFTDFKTEISDIETDIPSIEVSVKSVYNESVITDFTNKKESSQPHNSSIVAKKQHISHISQRSKTKNSNLLYKQNDDSVVPLNNDDGYVVPPLKDNSSIVPPIKDNSCAVPLNKKDGCVVPPDKDDDGVVPLNKDNGCVVSLNTNEFISTDKNVLVSKNNSRIIPSFMHKKKIISQCEMSIHREVSNISNICSSKLKPSFLPKNMRQVFNKAETSSAQTRTKRSFPLQLDNPSENVKKFNLINSFDVPVTFCRIPAELSPKNTNILKIQSKRHSADSLALCDSVPKVPKFSSGIKKSQKSVEIQKPQHPKIKHKQKKDNLINYSKQNLTIECVNVSQTLESLSSPLNLCATVTSLVADTNVKKQRPKPKVQDIDVESMAKNKMLGKVNLITLKKWLIGKGVSCKSTEKKEILVRKVEVFLNISQDKFV
ncbi:uncharacterized protein LOC105844100 isoform X1 [Hydra vulgaris]|uniref:uncharacterized protein LOC105844100 isoform X1 n=3 Tax=Hydra vulgaris TaxID=6087 RepID=UPI001F5EBF5E|nr:uncharacterized protein LOC105844100 isoform X1 [Hydra vulgaris]